ncbi:MD-2-related lipid recognition domain-containing protein / ML domain-containing protein [Quillaja saponaria]|uniref:MD-2-related lipid recognition domain-containing protein / ML domain-containing protein n=1 Tax=Quillaja saponaria TaxID=32244 RepID=A0AAD7KYA7_QUISA|nr:MD-2-related lipid recognition domain-containing protein / ML domain-containing protein [Quillaja saponaria]
MEVQSKLKLYFLACLPILVLLFSSAQAKGVKYCDKKGNYAVKVDGVKISPDPVVRGKPATFSISASAGEAISGGKLTIEVEYFGVHVHTETHDLCEETACPVAAGNFVISHSQILPAITPPGSYTLKLRLEDKHNQLLTCITFGFKIVLYSLASDI